MKPKYHEDEISQIEGNSDIKDEKMIEIFENAGVVEQQYFSLLKKYKNLK